MYTCGSMEVYILGGGLLLKGGSSHPLLPMSPGSEGNCIWCLQTMSLTRVCFSRKSIPPWEASPIHRTESGTELPRSSGCGFLLILFFSPYLRWFLRFLALCCRAPENTCLSNQYRCSNGNCINSIWQCDNDNDCGDMSDEKNCRKWPVLRGLVKRACAMFCALAHRQDRALVLDF